LRQDVGQVLDAYLDTRGRVLPDALGVPLLTAVGNRAGGRRLSRRGVRTIVDGHLRRLDLKRPGLSDYALRHTGATLAYKYTHDLRAVQDLLCHADLPTTAANVPYFVYRRGATLDQARPRVPALLGGVIGRCCWSASEARSAAPSLSAGGGRRALRGGHGAHP
jgi:site-specific recombinase XerC